MSEIAVIDQQPVSEIAARVQGLTSGNSVAYSSIKGDDFAARKTLYNAVSGALPIDDYLDTTFNLVNIVVSVVQLPDQNHPDVINDVPRVILVDDQGNAYQGFSPTLLSDVENVVGMLGEPHTWPEAVPVQVQTGKSKRGFRFFTLALV